MPRTLLIWPRRHYNLFFPSIKKTPLLEKKEKVNPCIAFFEFFFFSPLHILTHPVCLSLHVLGAPEVKQGVSEQFGDGFIGDEAAVVVTAETFHGQVILNEDRDVLLLLHAKSCEPCAHFTVYYKRMAARFVDLKIDSLVIARMDVTDESPPAHLNLMAGELPILVLFPAVGDELDRPLPIFYSGVGKIQQMMKWVQQHAAMPFELPNLPHLTNEQVELYKTQVRLCESIA
jgi:hypothetical protein